LKLWHNNTMKTWHMGTGGIAPQTHDTLQPILPPDRLNFTKYQHQFCFRMAYYHYVYEYNFLLQMSIKFRGMCSLFKLKTRFLWVCVVCGAFISHVAVWKQLHFNRWFIICAKNTHGKAALKSTIFWDITPCSPLKVSRRFGALLATSFHARFLLALFFDPEDGGDMFLRNIGWLSRDYMVLYPRRQNSS
jgi:hypothetical protein